MFGRRNVNGLTKKMNLCGKMNVECFEEKDECLAKEILKV
jgi:phosphoribosylaminoimidazole carboxylase (NCAIR synthetase)